MQNIKNGGEVYTIKFKYPDKKYSYFIKDFDIKIKRVFLYSKSEVMSIPFFTQQR